MVDMSSRHSLFRHRPEIFVLLTAGVLLFTFGCIPKRPLSSPQLPSSANSLRIVGIEINPEVARAHDEVSIKVTYTVWAPDPAQRIPVTETWIFLVNGRELGEPLLRPTQHKTSGEYTSTYKFTVTPDYLAGAYQVRVIITTGVISQSVEAEFSIRESSPPSDTLSSPLTRHEVRRLQRRLKAAGFDPGPIDGIFGPATRTALKQYQTAQGLSVTGELDPSTRQALGLE